MVGAVTGTLAAPERLILGQAGPDGRLLVAGSTAPLSPTQRLQIGGLLTPLGGAHPWPPTLSSTGGAWNSGRRRSPVTRVQPALDVEVEVDSSYTYGQIRHLARLIRTRPDLDPADMSAPPRDLSPRWPARPVRRRRGGKSLQLEMPETRRIGGVASP